jgi:serine/threonine-protein kinase PpkA
VNFQIPGYKMVRHIAEGGMASVYLAVQESLGRHVVIKQLKKVDDVYQSARFRHEGRIIASLNHRNIITIYDIGVIGEHYYISMEYLEGGDLEERMLSSISVDAALDLVDDIGSCLDFLHKQDIIHRDIKPANILFHEDGTPVLSDFGVAKQQEVNIKLTRDGTALGSPYYISPEQAECKVLDGRADIYSLGIILYEMLTGKKPYEGDSYMETIIAHICNPVPSLPPALACYQEVIDRMIAKDRNDRFNTAGEMVESIRALRSGNTAKPVKNRTRPAIPGFDQYGVGAINSATGGQASGHSRLNMSLANNSTVLIVGALLVTFVIAMGFLNIRAFVFPTTTTVSTRAQTTESTPGNAAQAAASTNPEHEEYLVKARRARGLLRFATPENDSAYYYYRKILEDDPDHPGALRGVAEIAEIYADLVEWAVNKGAYRKAREYVDTGLEVNPANERLLALQDTIPSPDSRSTHLSR